MIIRLLGIFFFFRPRSLEDLIFEYLTNKSQRNNHKFNSLHLIKTLLINVEAPSGRKIKDVS